MEKFVIHGGKPLVGEVEISGAKNAAVAILPATILAGGKCVIENLPNISDVSASVDILSAMGAQVREVSLPSTSYALSAYYIISSAEASSNLARYDGLR